MATVRRLCPQQHESLPDGFEYHVLKAGSARGLMKRCPCVSGCPALSTCRATSRWWAKAIRRRDPTHRETSPSPAPAAISASTRARRAAAAPSGRRHQYPRHQALRRRTTPACPAPPAPAETPQKNRRHRRRSLGLTAPLSAVGAQRHRF